LQWRPESDKSQFLASAGYTERDAELLARDIRRQLLPADAQFEEATAYGVLYSITAGLRGPQRHSIEGEEYLDGRIRD